MEGQKTTLELLEEQVEKLKLENDQLRKDKDMYEKWGRETDAKIMEMVESVKAITTIANMITKQAKN